MVMGVQLIINMEMGNRWVRGRCHLKKYVKFWETFFTLPMHQYDQTVSANQECVYIEPKCVQYGHILVQGAQKTG